MHAWKTIVSFWDGLFSGTTLVSGKVKSPIFYAKQRRLGEKIVPSTRPANSLIPASRRQGHCHENSIHQSNYETHTRRRCWNPREKRTWGARWDGKFGIGKFGSGAFYKFWRLFGGSTPSGFVNCSENDRYDWKEVG